MREAGQVFSMTPAELNMAFTAQGAQWERRQGEIWLLGRYVALAVHAPERLPPAPPAPVFCREMTDEEMKARLAGWARKGNNP